MSAPTVSDDSTAIGPRSRSPFVTYLLVHPVSVALSLVVVVTGLLFGTLWGRFPQELAAGPVTTAQLGYWWTPISALLIPDSAIEAVLVIALALTVVAYAERLLGSMCTVFVFFVTGALGILLGVGVQSLAAAWGEQWAQISQLDLVLDPPLGLFGVIMAGSALAPGLFRRRIRVLGFAALVMFTLYAGDSDSFYRLIAALLGLVAGVIFARGEATRAWRRSSYRETRTLTAAIVALTGLGPLIVVISGSTRGPLALIVSGFTMLDTEEVVNRCATVTSTQCDADLGVVLTAGVGPFLLSLVPLVLSLVAAWGLRIGRRSAWLLGIAVSAGLAVLTAVSLGAAQLLDAGTADILGPEYTFWAVAAVLVPVGVVSLLAVTWRRFQVPAPRAAALRFTATVVSAVVVLAVANLVVGFARSDDFLFPPEAGELLAGVVRPFIPAGFLTGIPLAAVPVGGLALLSYQWVGVIFWAVFIVAMLLLYRATPTGRNAAVEGRFRALLTRGGGGTLGFMGTWPGNEYWFSEDGTGAVAYRVINGVALTMSDPVSPAGEDAEVIRQFVDFCDRQGWATVFYSFHDRYLPVFQSFGWQYMSVGEETVLRLPSLDMAGKPWQKIRQALNKGTRAGITTVWSTWDDLPASAAAEIDAISEQWVAEKELPEMGFTLGGVEELKDPDVFLYLAMNPEGRIEAITSWLPSWTDGRVTGWTIDFMRRGDDSMPGIMEFVIASAALHMKDLGAEVMSLSGAPLASKPLPAGAEPAEPTVMTRLLGWLGGVLEPAYGFTSLFKFKSKFNPQYETIYMAYADPANLPTIGLAIGKAYLPDVSAREYVALARTLTSHRD